MLKLNAATAAAILAFAGTVSAHARVWSVWVNGEDQGDGRETYIRSPPNNNPLVDLTSPDIACNVNGGKPGTGFVEAKPGDTIQFEWYHDNRNDDIIASSHKGPLITYIAPYTDSDGAAPIWTKIHERGYDATTKKWAVDDLIDDKGKSKEITIPANLKAGDYLIRNEILGLHEGEVAYSAGKTRGTQFYPSCSQFRITGSGTAEPPQNFDFATGYTDDTPGIVFNIYGSFDSYPIPGPEVWTGGSSSGGSGSGSGSGNSTAPTTTKAPAASAQPTTLSTTKAPASSTKAAGGATSKAAGGATSTAAAAQPSQTGSSGCERRRKARRAAVKN